MIKIWLVTFSSGEEWHICGEMFDVYHAAKSYGQFDSIKYLRWV
jgi:hypothetical protein